MSRAQRFRCPGCGEHTAPSREELCGPCVESRPEESEGHALGDVTPWNDWDGYDE